MQQRAPRLGCSQPSGGMTVGEPSPATHRAATWRSPGTSAGRQHTVTTRFIYADRPCRLGEIRQPRTRTTRVKGDGSEQQRRSHPCCADRWEREVCRGSQASRVLSGIGFAVVRLGRREAAAG
jgi:hypothetical protein